MTQLRDAQGRFTKQNGSSNGSRPNKPMAELGVRSNRKWSAYSDEWLPHLRGTRAIRVYREMADNDDTIGAVLFAIEMLIRGASWNVEPGGDTPQDEEAKAFLESNRDDMSHSWEDFVASALTFLPYGWSFFETVYKRRDGINSRFDDGLIGWRKFAYQPQETLFEWETDEHGGVEAFKWQADGGRGTVPIDKGLLFRTTTARGPMGRSVLRNAYKSYTLKKRLEEYAAIGVERDLNGLPVMKVPVEVILENGPEYQAYKDFVTRIRKDELWGAVVPFAIDENGNEMYDFDVVTSGAGESINATRQLMSYFANNIAGVVLADFIKLGRDAVGSRALAEPKQQMFQQALEGWVSAMAEVLNRHAVPRLFALNGFNLETLPRFVPEPVEDVQLSDLGSFIRDTAQAGMDWGFFDEEDSTMADQVRAMAGFDSMSQFQKVRGVRFDPKSKTYKVR